MLAPIMLEHLFLSKCCHYKLC